MERRFLVIAACHDAACDDPLPSWRCWRWCSWRRVAVVVGARRSPRRRSTQTEQGARAPAHRSRRAHSDPRPGTPREQREGDSTTTVAPTTTTAPQITGTFTVAKTHQTFVDPTRSTPARGGEPASPRPNDRHHHLLPDAVAPSAAHRLRRSRRGPSRSSCSLTDTRSTRRPTRPSRKIWLRAGSSLPRPTSPAPARPTREERSAATRSQQPADISFVITSMINLSAAPGPLFDAVDPNAVGDAGQSDGGVTAAAAAYNTCCIDPRIKAGFDPHRGSVRVRRPMVPARNATGAVRARHRRRSEPVRRKHLDVRPGAVAQVPVHHRRRFPPRGLRRPAVGGTHRGRRWSRSSTSTSRATNPPPNA